MCCFRTGSGLNWLVITGPGSPALNAVLKPRDMPWHSSFVVSKTCDTSHLGALPRPRTDMKHSDFGRVTGFFNFSLPGFITLIWLLVPWGSPRMPEKPKQALQLLALARFDCISSGNSGALGDKEWIHAMWRQPADHPSGMLFGLESGCLLLASGSFASRFVRMRFASPGRSARVC